MNGPALFFVTGIIKLQSFKIGLFYCGYEHRGIMHEKTQEIFSRIRAGNAEETQIWFSYTAHFTSLYITHFLAFVSLAGWDWGLLIFLSQLSLGKSLLCPHFSQVDSSVQCERTAALYTCTVAASPDTHSSLTETDTLRTASLLASARPHSDPHTDSQYNNTSNISPQSRQLSNKFQWVESVFTRISLHHEAPPCLLNISQLTHWVIRTQFAVCRCRVDWYWQQLQANYHNDTSIKPGYSLENKSSLLEFPKCYQIYIVSKSCVYDITFPLISLSLVRGL